MANGDQSSDGRFDVVIAGGGATGLGCAVDAASRGYRTALVEADEFGSGTSSRSTKLIHGGVRYLAQLRFGLVREALAERAILRRTAPHLIHPIGIVVPVHSLVELAYYAAGLRLYDALAGRANLEPSRVLSAAATFEHVPNLRRARFRGGVRYVDAQFDDAGLLDALVKTARDLGAVVRNHTRVVRLLMTNSRVTGIVARSAGSEDEIILSARAVINATGVWSDTLRKLSDPDAKPMLSPSRGSHLIFDAGVLGRDDGFLIPKTDDGRVIFALPWKGGTLVGTTEIPVTAVDPNPQATQDEIEYLIEHLNRYLERPVTRADVRASYAGLRPLIRAGSASTAGLSREHLVEVDANGLISVLGGKWTTYRRMAKDAIDTAARVAELPRVASHTDQLPLASA
jgi:glycerol-3-phosphate dehydrogenase